MRHSHAFLFTILLAACDGDRDASDNDLSAAFREAVSIDVSAPAPNAPVVATLTPGAPFAFGDRYAYATAPGVGPAMTRFTPANVDTIPRFNSGDIIAVKRGSQVSRVRLVGFNDAGGVVFRSQASSPFVHGFSAVPWSAWNGQANAMQTCAAGVADEWHGCVATVGDGAWCRLAGDEELDDCASGQDYGIEPEFGGIEHVEFECFMPFPHYLEFINEPMNLNDCDGTFSGTVTQESGEFGCENVYSGVYTGGEDCLGQSVILDRVPEFDLGL
jgi:hypothetical protein